MKNLFITILIYLLMTTVHSLAETGKKRGVMEKLKTATCEGFFFGIKAGKDCHKRIKATSEIDKIKEKKSKREAKKSKFKKKVCEGYFFGIKAGKDCDKFLKQEKKIAKKNIEKYSYDKSLSETDLSLYTGTFDVIDKEGDDQTTLVGVEHRNPNLFINTFLGKLAPVTGAFVTGNNSLYFYTGIEGQYSLGPLNISPSFTPGYYEKGDGKDLGSAMEFKSEIKVGFDILKDSKLGYSYSHISNNDWGETNPGTDNQQITFSKQF